MRSSMSSARRMGSSRSARPCRSPRRTTGVMPRAGATRRPEADRARRDASLVTDIERVWLANLQVYGADKVWRQLQRDGVMVARCTVERLMRRPGLRGARRGKRVRTTIPAPKAASPLDRVQRQFKADRPNQLRVSDFTCVSTWQGWRYVAFVIDVNVFARRIVGWRVSRSMHTDFVLDALEQALHARQPGQDDALIHQQRPRRAVRLDPLHRTSAGGRHRAIGRQHRRQLRQRLGRDHQRPVQGRVDPPACALEDAGGAGTGHAGMGGLVQPSAPPRTDRLPAAGRGQLPSSTRRAGRGGLTHTNGPPRFPGRFSSVTSGFAADCVVSVSLSGCGVCGSVLPIDGASKPAFT